MKNHFALWLLLLLLVSKQVEAQQQCSGFFTCIIYGIFHFVGDFVNLVMADMRNVWFLFTGGPCSFMNNPCGPNGDCALNENEYNTARCVCHNEWQGDFCDQQFPPCDDPNWYGPDCKYCVMGSDACGERQQCKPQDEDDDHFTECVCADGWELGSGDYGPCGACILEHAANVCGEHGHCSESGFGSYDNVCKCDAGWSGIDCNKACNDTNWYGPDCKYCVLGSDVCGERQQCKPQDADDNYFTECVCADGWEQITRDGPCDHCIIESAVNGCGDHGYCKFVGYENECLCNAGWGGIGCNEACDDPDKYGRSCQNCVVGSDICGENAECKLSVHLDIVMGRHHYISGCICEPGWAMLGFSGWGDAMWDMECNTTCDANWYGDWYTGSQVNPCQVCAGGVLKHL